MKLLLAALLLATAGPVEPAPTIELRAEARTPGTRILVEDVISADSAATLSEDLLDTDLGRSPSPGFGRLITREAVRAALPEGAAALVGPAEVTVHTDVVLVEPGKVIAKARKFLDSSLPLPEGTIVEVSRQPFEATVPRGRRSLELVQRFRNTPTGRGYITVITEVHVDGTLQIIVPTTFLVRTFADLPVLATNLERGQSLAPLNIKSVRTETTQMMRQPLVDTASFIGLVARRRLAAGSPLRAPDYQPAILVRRGDPVTLVFKSGALRAEVFGISRDDGTLDSTVRVENLTTRRQLVGRVVGPGLVRMNP